MIPELERRRLEIESVELTEEEIKIALYAARLVKIIKRASVEEGIAIFKSLSWSIDRALKARRIKQ